MTLDTWLMFSLAAFITICSPGPAVLLAITNSVSSGMKSVIASSLGNITGLLILSSISILGLGVVIQTSAILFMTLKLMGAAYLIYLGVKKFRSNESFLVDYDIDHKPAKADYEKKFKESFFVAITNPKAVLFFVAFFPLFMDSSRPALAQFMAMTATFMGISFSTLMVYGLLAHSARRYFRNQSTVKLFHKITGGVFVGFGLALLQVKN
jgi:threonine/homoserine/homoserine lactone efflux protein